MRTEIKDLHIIVNSIADGDKKAWDDLLDYIKEVKKQTLQDVWIKLDKIILNHRKIINPREFQYNTNNPHIELILDLEALKYKLTKNEN